MAEFSPGAITKVAMLLAVGVMAAAQTAQQQGTLVISGEQEHAALVRINGKSYVDVESLARLTHGSLRFQGDQTILTLPSAPGAQAASARLPQLSEGYLAAEIEALTQLSEWRAALANAIENNYPVAQDWVSRLERSAEAKLQLAIAATTTGPDGKASELLRNEFASMQQMSDQFVAMHAKDNYIPPDSLDNSTLDAKVQDCEHALISMAATKQFQDAPSCH